MPAGESGFDEIARRAARDGRAAWPTLARDEEEFAASIRERLAGESDRAVGELHAADLYLATACSCGDARAHAALDEHFLRKLDVFVARVDPSPAFFDDVLQVAREKL